MACVAARAQCAQCALLLLLAPLLLALAAGSVRGATTTCALNTACASSSDCTPGSTYCRGGVCVGPTLVDEGMACNVSAGVYVCRCMFCLLCWLTLARRPTLHYTHPSTHTHIHRAICLRR